MVTAAIDVHRVGELPPVCVKTGMATQDVKKQEFAELPGWTLLLIFWGLIPFLIAAGFARRKIAVDLPLSADTRRRVRMVDAASIIGLLLGIGLVATSLPTREGWWAGAGIALVLIVLVGGAIARHITWVGGRLDGDVLILYRVHPTFAEAAAELAGSEVNNADNRTMALMLTGAVTVLVLLFVLLWVR